MTDHTLLLKNREERFNRYIPAIRKMAKEHGEPFSSWEDVETQRTDFLSSLPKQSDLLVFAYGSLMWNPMLRYSEQYPAHLNGFRRHFCLDMIFFRGSTETPGLMMALDHGGECQGLCYRIPAQWVEEETRMLWRREMCLDGYHTEWINPDISGLSESLPCLTFVINPENNRYLNSLTKEESALRIQQAKGAFGTNIEYFDNTLQHLREMNIHDQELEQLDQLIQRL